MRVLMWVGVAGFLGAVCRYLVGHAVYRVLPATFPYGTLVVNVVGSLLLGLVFALGTERAVLDPTVRVALASGFLGAFTTFSTFSLETVNLVREGSMLMAGVNVVANLVVCLVAVAVGMLVARML